MSPDRKFDPITGQHEHEVSPAPHAVITKPESDADAKAVLVEYVDVGEEVLNELIGQAKHERLSNAESRFRRLLPRARAALVHLGALGVVLFICLGVAMGQIQQPLFPASNNAQSAAVGPAGAVVNSSGNLITVAPGPVYCSGATSWIHSTVFNLTGPNAVPAVASADGQSITFFIFFRCSGDQLLISTFPPQVPNDVPLATVKQANAAGSLSYTIVDIRPVAFFPNVADFVIPFGPGDCAWNSTGTLGAAATLGLIDIGANLTEVNQITATNAGASTNQLSCNIHIPQRTSASKGVSLNDCVIYYGVQQTALTSVGAPSLSTITMPAPGTGETPSTVAPVSLGANVVLPVIGSANLGLTTAGAFFTEKVTLTVPVFLNTDLQEVLFQQTFVQSAAAAQSVNTPGGVCHAQQVLN